MRTINSHRGPSLSSSHSFSLSLSQPRLAKQYTDENIAGNTEKALITEGVYGGGKEGKEMKIPCASETFPVQFNMLHQLFLICCFLHKIVHFLHQVTIPQGSMVEPSPSKL